MAFKPPSPSTPLEIWLVGISWVLVLVLIPMALLSAGLESGLFAGKPHG